MMYKQVIVDRYEVYDVDLDVIKDKMQILDMDTVEVEDLDSYNLEGEFEDMFSPLHFWEGKNHVITVQLFRMEDDECTDDPVHQHSFRVPYLD